MSTKNKKHDKAASQVDPATRPLADATNVPATVKGGQKAKGGKAASAARFTQADIDALTDQFRAEVAAATAQLQAEREAERADYERRLDNLQHVADAAAEEAAVDTSEDNTVGKPRGSAGDGFRLIDVMGLTNDKLEYDLIRRKVHGMCARVKLEMTKPYSKQEGRKMVHLCEKMREEFPYLRRFIGDWPTKELTRQYLKHVRAYEKSKQAAIAAAVESRKLKQARGRRSTRQTSSRT